MIRETLGLTKTAMRDLQRLGGLQGRGARRLTERVLTRDTSWQARPPCGDGFWEWKTAERGRPLVDETALPLQLERSPDRGGRVTV